MFLRVAVVLIAGHDGQGVHTSYGLLNDIIICFMVVFCGCGCVYFQGFHCTVNMEELRDICH